MSATSELVRPRPPALPANTVEMDALRKVARQWTLNDYVEVHHRALFDDPKYQRLIDAVYDEDAVEGSLSTDNIMAAIMIRDRAAKDNLDPYVAGKKLATIAKALGVVLRRYGISRKERARMINGEAVFDNGSVAE